MLTFGGGHADYCGNDIYRFRLSTLKWERAGISSRMALFQRNDKIQIALPADGPENAPATSHMYDGLSFLTQADRMIYFGVGTPFFAGTGAPTAPEPKPPHTGPWLFDPSKGDANKVVGSDGSAVDPSIRGGHMWENRDFAAKHPYEVIPRSFGAPSPSTATACENGHDVVYTRTSDPAHVSSGLFKYSVMDERDPTRDVLVQAGGQGNQMSQADMAVDTTRGVVVMMGDRARHFTFWDISRLDGHSPMQSVPSIVDLTGGYALNQNAGMDYDPQRGRFVLWDGASGVWELRLPNTTPVSVTGWEVRQILDLGGPAGELLPRSGGAIGKWKYAAGLDVFLALREAPDGDVWIFKPEQWHDPAR
jgi:hypothetical protein